MALSEAAVVFDMDGILIDSEPLFRLAAQRAARDLGYTVSDAVYVTWMGLPPAAVEAAVYSSLGDDFPMTAFRDRFQAIWIEHTNTHGVAAKPGIADLLAFLKERGTAFAVATSTHRQQAERSLELAGLLDFFDVIVSGDEVTHGKPAPDIFERAAHLINRAPPDCTALEDSAAGIRSASAAGMLTVMVPDLHWPDDEVCALARYVLPDTLRAATVIKALLNKENA